MSKTSTDHGEGRVVLAIPFAQLQAQTVPLRRQMAFVLALLLSACGGGEAPKFTLTPSPTYEAPTPSTIYETPTPSSVYETVTPSSILSRQDICVYEGEEYGLDVVTTNVAEIPYLA